MRSPLAKVFDLTSLYQFLSKRQIKNRPPDPWFWGHHLLLWLGQTLCCGICLSKRIRSDAYAFTYRQILVIQDVQLMAAQITTFGKAFVF
jgi:hypothetical protein